MLSHATRVKGVAQAVTDEVNGEDGEGYSDTGEDDGVLALDEDAESRAEGVGEHRSPLGRRSAGAEAEERESGHVQYRRCERQCSLHYERRHAVRQYARKDDLGVACSEGPFGFDVITFSDADHGGPDNAGDLGYEHDAYGEHRVRQGGPQNGDDDDREQDAREGEKHVHQAHKYRVGPLP